MMRVVTWNINSARLRVDLVRRFAEEYSPDVLCLQETKCPDDDFPHGAFGDMGFEYRAIRGEKSYNGVAILSKVAIAESSFKLWAGVDDKRHISVILENGVEVHNFYVPAGGDIADVSVNPKFAHKLRFLGEVGDYFSGEGSAKGEGSGRRILLGDLNIAFGEHDVWSHKALLKVVSYTEVERELLWGIFQSGGWVDGVRGLHGEDERLYSWWSYRGKDWEGSDRGRRLDHIWVSENLRDGLRSCEIVRKYRGIVEKPSDHVPIILDIDV